MISNLLLTREPNPCIILDGVNGVPLSTDNCWEVEKFGIPITVFKPHLPWFLFPENFITTEPFIKITLEISFKSGIQLCSVQFLNFFNLVREFLNLGMRMTKKIPVPYLQSWSGLQLFMTQDIGWRAYGLWIPCLFYHPTASRISNPHSFESEWSWGEFFNWVCVNQQGVMIRINCTKVDNWGFWKSHSPTWTCKSSIQRSLMVLWESRPLTQCKGLNIILKNGYYTVFHPNV